ncbi:MAG: hypothetical protein P0Y55_13275 [Candidatus Cohnella colombiensis]|uniref:Uncharacterized protein n=1 Tax=Candidatus Cohnella colombiensis TaxID=3121368 RepID=A0AA95EX40_9BACL|nr:MAG: hypothetical protein P0Y55_13275 [Cohnella sp.]
MKIRLLRNLVLLFLMLCVALPGGLLQPIYEVQAASVKPVATYTSPQKIKFVSYSKAWTVAKLKQLSAELLKNVHGEELAYLSEVELSAVNKEGEDGVAHMNYSWTKGDMSDLVMDKGTKIVLYNANSNTTIESVAATLSHEYGHHFTHYWLMKKEHKLPSNPKSKWVALRGIKGYPVVFTEDAEEPGYSHFWDAAEIMADDYMVMFGSPTGKQAMANSMLKEEIGFFQGVENEQIPSVMALPKVRSYWLQLSGIKDPQPLSFKEPKLTAITAVTTIDGDIVHKFTYEAGSTNAELAKRLQYGVYWSEDASDESFSIDYTELVTGKLSIQLDYALPQAKRVIITVYAYDPKTKQYVYAKRQAYNLSNLKKPIKLAQ